MFTVAVTGHRPQKLWGFNMKDPRYQALYNEMYNLLVELYNENCTNKSDNKMLLVNGGALGVDQLFWEASIAIRDRFAAPDTVAVEEAAPCMNHSSRWPISSQRHYSELLDHTDIRTIVTQTAYTPACMQKRNEYMVDKADVLIAVWNGKAGGTANCVEYAQRKGKKVILINPEDMK